MFAIPRWTAADSVLRQLLARLTKNSINTMTLRLVEIPPIVRSGVRVKRTTTCDDPAGSGTTICDVSRFGGCDFTTLSFTSMRHAG
jgi:hypothetical protein